MTRGWLAVAVLVAGAGIAVGQEATQSGAIPPQVITVVKAVYTKEARAAKIEGTVVLEATVLTDGTVADNVKVVRSLDTKFGLDEQAIKATKQWKFKPATKDGQPVPCPVAIEQSFFLNSTK